MIYYPGKYVRSWMRRHLDEPVTWLALDLVGCGMTLALVSFIAGYFFGRAIL